MVENPPFRRRRFRFLQWGMLVGVAVPTVTFAWMEFSRRSRSLDEMETILQSGQLELEQLQGAERQVPHVIPRLEMRRAELVRDRAQLNVDRARAVPVWHRERIRDLDRRLASLQTEILETELEQAEITSYKNEEHRLELGRRIAAIRSELARRGDEPTSCRCRLSWRKRETVDVRGERRVLSRQPADQCQ